MKVQKHCAYTHQRIEIPRYGNRRENIATNGRTWDCSFLSRSHKHPSLCPYSSQSLFPSLIAHANGFTIFRLQSAPQKNQLNNKKLFHFAETRMAVLHVMWFAAQHHLYRDIHYILSFVSFAPYWKLWMSHMNVICGSFVGVLEYWIYFTRIRFNVIISPVTIFDRSVPHTMSEVLQQTLIPIQLCTNLIRLLLHFIRLRQKQIKFNDDALIYSAVLVFAATMPMYA